jgi:transposase-like protein
VPTKITLDAYAASHRAVREMKQTGELPGRVKLRPSQYLNNLGEQDHRRVDQGIRPMLGFKRFEPKGYGVGVVGTPALAA